MSNETIITELKIAYAMEHETVQNYIAASVNLDGVRSDVIKKALAADILEELSHAQTIAKRIKTIGGTVPGSLDLERRQKSLQPLQDSTDVVSVIKGVIDAEEGAIAQYNKTSSPCRASRAESSASASSGPSSATNSLSKSEPATFSTGNTAASMSSSYASTASGKVSSPSCHRQIHRRFEFSVTTRDSQCQISRRSHRLKAAAMVAATT